MNKFVGLTLNIAGGIFFFFFFLFVFFPFESVIHNMLGKLESQSGGAFRILVKEINPNIIFKSVFKDVRLVSRGAEGEQIVASFPRVRVGLSYLSLLTGKLKSSFVAEGKKGEIEGELFLSPSEYRVHADVDNLPLQDVPYLNSLMDVLPEGSLSGSVHLNLFPEQVTKHDGKIDLKLVSVKIPASRITPYPGVDLDLPETVLSDNKGGRIKLSIEKGKVEVEEVSLPGGDLILRLNGRIQLNKKTALSRLTLTGSFQVSDKMREALPMLVIIEKQKGEDGFYPLSLSGRLSKPQIRVGTFEVL